MPAPTEAERQLSAKLHVLYGVSVEPAEEDGPPLHPYARARVYDLRRYNDQNFWGPFLDDGSQDVDWEKVQAIMIVLDYNIRNFCKRTNGRFRPFWDAPFAGAMEGSYTSFSAPPGLVKEPALPLAAQDPYDVTGTWMRVGAILPLQLT